MGCLFSSGRQISQTTSDDRLLRHADRGPHADRSSLRHWTQWPPATASENRCCAVRARCSALFALSLYRWQYGLGDLARRQRTRRCGDRGRRQALGGGGISGAIVGVASEATVETNLGAAGDALCHREDLTKGCSLVHVIVTTDVTAVPCKQLL